MLKRLLCTVFLAVFCFGNAAYAISNDAMKNKLQSTLRKDLTGWVLDTARQECRQAGLDAPQDVSIAVEGLNDDFCYLSFQLSSYVPAELAGNLAKFVGTSAAAILNENGKCPEGYIILVLPGYGAGGEMYDVQSLKIEKDGNFSFASIPVEEFFKALQ